MGDQGAFIGRHAELGTLVGALDRAAAGTTGVVLVGGDAGVGKSYLVGALTRIGRERGCTVLVGQCAELGESMPYLPLADALWAASGDETVAAALASRPVLSRLLPDGAENGGDLKGELVQQQLFGAVLGLLGELGRRAPVVLVLEDLHWADRSTRHLLTFLCRVLQRERVCLVGTYRSDDLHRRHPLRPVVAELLRLPEVTGIQLGPFGLDETAEYLTSLSEGDPPTAEEVGRVHRRSEGNAFYAAELFSASRAGEELPAGLADLLLARVERLSEPASRVVRAASVAGNRVDDELLRQVCGLGGAEAGEALREIVSHRLLIPDGADGYRFRHALLREAVYADLLPGERTRLHAAYAALLSDGPGGQGGRGQVAAELAHHSFAAHDLPAALAASVRAGDRAERMGAPHEAHEHYDRALSIWDSVPDAERVAGVDHVDLELNAVRASGRAGEPRRAIARLRRILDELDPTDARRGVTARAWLAHYLGDINQVQEAIVVSEEALGMLPADPPTAERALALSVYSRMLLADEHEGPSALAIAEETIATARAVGDTDAEAAALISLALYREDHQADPEIGALFDRARELALGKGDNLIGLRAAFHRARSLFDHGDLAGARAAAAKDLEFTLAGGLGWSNFGVILRCLDFLIRYTAGDWDEAERLAADFPVQVTRPAEAQLSAYALFLEVARGTDIADRQRWLEPIWPQDDFVAYVARGLIAEHALWQGDLDTALGHVDIVLSDLLPRYDDSSIRIATTGLWAHADRAVQARAIGDTETAEKSAKAADALLFRVQDAASTAQTGKPRAWSGVEGLAWVARAKAEHARAHGRNDPKLWRATVEGFSYGFTYEVARSRWRLAESLAEQGDREAAQLEWSQAVQEAESLGAAPLLKALHTLGTRARLDSPARETASHGLTTRELEVLKLVAEGRNNREIAATLFISPKTVSVHVSNILAKLQVTSRTQAAAKAHNEGLLNA